MQWWKLCELLSASSSNKTIFVLSHAHMHSLQLMEIELAWENMLPGHFTWCSVCGIWRVRWWIWCIWCWTKLNFSSGKRNFMFIEIDWKPIYPANVHTWSSVNNCGWLMMDCNSWLVVCLNGWLMVCLNGWLMVDLDGWLVNSNWCWVGRVSGVCRWSWSSMDILWLCVDILRLCLDIGGVWWCSISDLLLDLISWVRHTHIWFVDWWVWCLNRLWVVWNLLQVAIWSQHILLFACNCWCDDRGAIVVGDSCIAGGDESQEADKLAIEK